MSLAKIDRDLNKFFNPHRAPARKAPTAQHFAILPDGREIEIKRRKAGSRAYFEVHIPGDTPWSTSLRDAKHFLARDFPGVRFETRE
jgi:hypothetical protein